MESDQLDGVVPGPSLPLCPRCVRRGSPLGGPEDAKLGQFRLDEVRRTTQVACRKPTRYRAEPGRARRMRSCSDENINHRLTARLDPADSEATHSNNGCTR